MTMPKAPLNENYSFILWQNNIRLTRQIFYVQSVAKSL